MIHFYKKLFAVPLFVGTTLFISTVSAMQKTVNHVLDADDNYTELHLAAHHGNYERCKSLLDSNANIDIVAKVAGEECTPLTEASDEDHYEVCQLLLAYKADVRRPKIFPLYLSTRHNSVDVCKLLVENGADINKTFKEIFSPIQEALTHVYPYPFLAKIFISFGAKAEVIYLKPYKTKFNKLLKELTKEFESESQKSAKLIELSQAILPFVEVRAIATLTAEYAEISTFDEFIKWNKLIAQENYVRLHASAKATSSSQAQQKLSNSF